MLPTRQFSACRSTSARIGFIGLTAIRLADRLQATGLDIYAAPRGQAVRIGPRNARDAELEAFLPALVRSRRAIVDAGRSRADGAAARALPADLGDWRATIEFMLGPFACGKDLASVSTVDLARVPERDNDAFCRQGYGALIAKLAAGLADASVDTCHAY